MKNSDLQRIKHIKSYCDDIMEFVDRFGKDFDVFTNDKAYYNSVAMCLLQIGELTKGLSDEFRNETNKIIPWKMISGMRDYLAHAYATVDDDMIWSTVTEDIPLLLNFCNSQIDN